MELADTVKTFIADNWLSVLIAAIMALFGGGGIVAYLKNRSEAPKILVDAAQGAVVVQSSVITSLREDLNSARAEISELRSHMAELNSLRSRVRELEHDNEILKAENSSLASEVEALKTRLNSNGLR